MSETKDPVCGGHYYAAGKNKNEEGCVAYSGDDPRDDIEATKISGSVLLSNGTMSGNLTGIKLEYTNGATCPSSGEKYSFSINVYCAPDIEEADYIPLAHGD